MKSKMTYSLGSKFIPIKFILTTIQKIAFLWLLTFVDRTLHGKVVKLYPMDIKPSTVACLLFQSEVYTTLMTSCTIQKI